MKALKFFAKVYLMLRSFVHKNWHVNYYLNILSFFGCWSGFDDHGSGKFHWRFWLPRFCILNTAFCSVVLGPVTIYKFWGQKASKVLEPTIGMMIYGMMCFSITALMHKDSSLKNTIVEMNIMKVYERLHVERKKEITDEVGIFSTAIFCYYAMSSIGLITCSTALGIFSWKSETNYFSFWIPYDMSVPVTCELTLILLYVPGAFGIYLLMVSHCVFMTLMLQAVYHLKLLAHNLGNAHCVKGSILTRVKRRTTCPTTATKFVRRTSGRNLGKSSKPQHFLVSTSNQAVNDFFERKADRLRTCVLHHCAIIRFVKRINHTFDWMLMEYFAVSTFPSIVWIVLLQNNEIDMKTIFSLSLIIVALGDLGAFCGLGQAVKDQSNSVRNAAFGCKWLGASVGFNRSLQIIMTHSNKPLVLKVFRFIPLTLKTFGKVLRIGFNYYMSLLALIY